MDIDLTKKIVVWDASGPMATENKCFNRKLTKDKWYALSGADLYDLCLSHGIQLVTADIYLNFVKKPNAIFIRDGTGAHHTAKLIRAGARPAVLIVGEHPLYAPRPYFNLKKITRDFDHVFAPTGAQILLSPHAKFHTWRGTQSYSGKITNVEYVSGKKYLVLMNSNHRIHRLKLWYTTIMNTMRPLPTFVNRELYIDRLEAIHYFSKHSDFDLYGYGWDRPVRYTHGKYADAIQKSYRGIVDDKFAVMQKYKFSICFENAIFAGWVTEKITDSMFAGCVPIYWGDPNISAIFPQDTFIDFRKFKTYADLDAFLRGMDEGTYRGYIKNIDRFIHSDACYNLSHEKFFKDLITIFESYF